MTWGSNLAASGRERVESRIEARSSPRDCDDGHNDAMVQPRRATTEWSDLRTLGVGLDDPVSRRLDPADREALRAALGRVAQIPRGDLIVAADRPIGRVEGHGTVVLYRPDPAGGLEHRLLEVDPSGAVTAAFNRDARGELREAWVSLADRGMLGLLPGGAHHPLWGHSDRLVALTGTGSPTTLTLARAVQWSAVDTIPPVAEPARLPNGAGAALMNVLAALARDQGRPALRYRGPYPTEQLFWSLTESFRCAPGPDALARFLGEAEATFARGALAEAPVDWAPAPHERRLHPDGLVVQLRDGVERISWQGRSYYRTETQGLRRREHRVVRAVEAEGGARRYVASLEALDTVVEDHLTLDARGQPIERHAPTVDAALEEPLTGAWIEALGALLPLEATLLLAGAIEAVWPGIQLAWGPVTGDLVASRGAALRLSPKLARVYRSAWAGSARDARRALARRMVRDVLGLIGPIVREAAVEWLGGLAPARQEEELAAAARRERAVLAEKALGPLGRLLDALGGGAALPG
jgi:hypothetical protein